MDLAPRSIWGAGAVACLALTCRSPPPLLEVEVTPRGHDEVVVAADGTVLPLVLGRERPVGLCFEVGAEIDTGQWEAELRFEDRPSPTGFAPAAAHMGRTLCFDGVLPDSLPASGEVEMCGEVVDRYDGQRWRLPCRTLGFEQEATAYRARMEALSSLLRTRFDDDLATFIDGLDELRSASGGRFPLLEVRMDLIAAHYLTLEGSPEALAEARRRLDALPAWLEQAAATSFRARAAYQRAFFYLNGERHLDRAWQELEKADRASLRLAEGRRILGVLHQAAVLAEVGAVREAIRRLRAALSDCEHVLCENPFVSTARANLAWFILMDADADDDELAEAEEALDAGQPSTDAAEYPLERANQLLDLAFLRVRQGQDPSESIEQARQLLAGVRIADDEVGMLEAWSQLVAGLGHLAMGEPERARERCASLTARSERVLAGWAWMCLGRAHRARGESAAAERAFEQALVHYEVVDLADLGRQVPVGPGQRAEAFAEVARSAVEAGDAARAWATLARLDDRSAHEGARRRCREQASEPAIRDRWHALAEERSALLAELDALEIPAALSAERQRETRRRQVQQRLRELWWDWPGCDTRPAEEPGEPRFRAFALHDEIFLLRRKEDGNVVVERRTPLPSRRLRRLSQRIVAATDRGDLDDEAWYELTLPLAQSLLPRSTAGLEPVTPFALHGLLQTVPVAALPLPKGDGSGARWFGEVTSVVIVPAGAVAAPAAEPTSPPLFVVDPREDLEGARQLLETYRNLFPDARFLTGRQATSAALRDHLSRASWLHVDAHGLYDAVIPELSALELADRPLHLMELAELPAPGVFVNLSGCRTGRWPVTADSGRYGIGGLFTRLGVAWVIASRSDLAEVVARDFNRAFYAALERLADVPAAYRQALRELSRHHRASAWAGILLLGASEGAIGSSVDSPGGRKKARTVQPPIAGGAA